MPICASVSHSIITANAKVCYLLFVCWAVLVSHSIIVAIAIFFFLFDVCYLLCVICLGLHASVSHSIIGAIAESVVICMGRHVQVQESYSPTYYCCGHCQRFCCLLFVLCVGPVSKCPTCIVVCF